MVPFPDLTPLFSLGRAAVGLYAAGATILTTACLLLHVITTLDRHTTGARAKRDRSLFVPLESGPHPSTERATGEE